VSAGLQRKGVDSCGVVKSVQIAVKWRRSSAACWPT